MASKVEKPELVAEVAEVAVETAPKVYIVKSPIKDFCGVNAGGVQFAYGQAEVNEGWVLDWYKSHGYAVAEKE